MEDYPSKACVILDEVLSCVDVRAKMDNLEKIKSRIHHSMLYDSYRSSDDHKNFNKVYNSVMTAFLDFVHYCEDKPPRDSFGYSTEYNTSDD